MALQGTLDTFALPDVLRLLAATRKSGQLRIDGDRGSGSAWVLEGEITAVEAAHAPRATDPAEALFELLRFEEGSFSFDAEAPTHGGARAEVEPLLEAAEALLADWREIEAVVPSLSSWVTLRPDLAGDDVTIDGARWRTLVAVGGGRTVAAIGDELDLSELPVSRAVRDLVELGVVELEARAPEPAPAPAAEERATLAPVTARREAPEPAPAEPASAAPTNTNSNSNGNGDSAREGEAALPGPRALRPRGRRGQLAAADEPGVFVPLELEHLQRGASADASGDDVSDEDLAAAFPGLAAHAAEASAPEADADDDDADDDLAREMANLSPRAAAAVRAAASAETDEEREAALDAAEEDGEPLNRGLLLKFLSSVKS